MIVSSVVCSEPLIRSLSTDKVYRSMRSSTEVGRELDWRINIARTGPAPVSSNCRDRSCTEGLLLQSQTYFLVGIIIATICKVLGTRWTFEWSLTGVNPLMSLPDMFMRELLVAEFAVV